MYISCWQKDPSVVYKCMIHTYIRPFDSFLITTGSNVKSQQAPFSLHKLHKQHRGFDPKDPLIVKISRNSSEKVLFGKSIWRGPKKTSHKSSRRHALPPCSRRRGRKHRGGGWIESHCWPLWLLSTNRRARFDGIDQWEQGRQQRRGEWWNFRLFQLPRQGPGPGHHSQNLKTINFRLFRFLSKSRFFQK